MKGFDVSQALFSPKLWFSTGLRGNLSISQGLPLKVEGKHGLIASMASLGGLEFDVSDANPPEYTREGKLDTFGLYRNQAGTPVIGAEESLLDGFEPMVEAEYALRIPKDFAVYLTGYYLRYGKLKHSSFTSVVTSSGDLVCFLEKDAKYYLMSKAAHDKGQRTFKYGINTWRPDIFEIFCDENGLNLISQKDKSAAEQLKKNDQKLALIAQAEQDEVR